MQNYKKETKLQRFYLDKNAFEHDLVPIESVENTPFAHDGDGLLLRAENEETKVAFKRDAAGRETFKSVGARNVEQFRSHYTWDMFNRLLVARDEITGRVARYDYDEFDNLFSAEYEHGSEVD